MIINDMKRYEKHTRLFLDIICLLFIMLFVYAGLTKLLEGDRFYKNLNNSPLFGVKDMALAISWLIPFLEILVAALLAWPRTRLQGLYGALILMVLFTAYVAVILLYSPYVPCSCGGIITLLSWKQHFIFNIVWIGLAITGIFILRKAQRKNTWQPTIEEYKQ